MEKTTTNIKKIGRPKLPKINVEKNKSYEVFLKDYKTNSWVSHNTYYYFSEISKEFNLPINIIKKLIHKILCSLML